jgi:hypothetical protein
MWFMSFTFGLCHNMRPGGAIRGKWRILDGNVRVICFHIRSFEGGSPCLCRLGTASVEP